MGFAKRRKRRHLDSASAGNRAKHLRPPDKTLAESPGSHSTDSLFRDVNHRRFRRQY